MNRAYTAYFKDHLKYRLLNPFNSNDIRNKYTLKCRILTDLTDNTLIHSYII